MFTCTYIGRYTHTESQQQWVMAEPVLLSTAAQQEPRQQDRVGSRFWTYRSIDLLLEHAGRFRQPEPVTKSSMSLSMNLQIFRQELCRRGNETERDLGFSFISKSLWPQRVAKRSSRFCPFLGRLLCNVPKEGFCASAFCILATFSCSGDSFQSKSHNEGYNSGIKNWGNWGTCKMDHHPRISIIFISMGKI